MTRRSAFFRKVAGSVAAGDTVLLAAKLDGKIVGTVQLGLDTPPNQPHRADIKKMLVHRSARGRGIGAALMARVEDEARRHGRWLLVLDTVPGENGYRLYRRAGWTESGIIPDYALFPDGPAVRHRVVLEAAGSRDFLLLLTAQAAAAVHARTAKANRRGLPSPGCDRRGGPA